MIHDDLQVIRFGYLRRVLAERWPLPSRVPAMLDVSRDSGGLSAGFVRLGFRVEGIRLQDTSVESLSQRLGGRTAAFDVVCCRDVLEQVDDWPAMVGVMARALRSGGVFFYSVSRRANELIPPRDLHATLRQKGLFPQRVVGLGHGVSRPAMSRAVRDGVVSYMGYAFRRRDRLPSLTEGSWRFRKTLEHWVYVPTEQDRAG